MDRAPMMRQALALLLQAHEYATQLQCDAWEFAVEVGSFREAGLTNNDIRWLLLRGYVAHAWEATTGEQFRRTFEPRGGLLGERSCFILTPTGLAFALGGAAGGPNGCAPPPGGAPPRTPPDAPRRRPVWKKDHRALWFGPHLVKQFKVPAVNQEIILAAFAEEDWPARIDDPLPQHASIDPRRRLHDTINSLNRNQRFPALHFSGDGTGQAICWEALPDASGADGNGAARPVGALGGNG